MFDAHIQTLAEFEAETRALTRRPFKFGPVFWQDIERPGKDYEWVIKGVIPEREVILGFGDSQTGKSFLFSDMGMSVSRGIPYMGKKTKQGLVVYVALEAGRGFRKRMKAYREYHKIDGDVPFVALTRRANLFSSETDIVDLIADIQGICEVYPDFPLMMVVLDTWSAGTRGSNENSGEDVSKVLERVYQLRDQCETSVVIVHHKPKSSATPRGHGSLTGDLETTIEIARADRRDKEGREVRYAKLTKQREGEDGVRWEFVLKQVVLGFDADGDKITSCIVDLPAGSDGTVEEPEAKGRIRQTEDGRWFLPPKLTIGFLALHDALAAVGRPPPAHVKAPAKVLCVTLSDWRNEWESAAKKEDEDPDKLKERVKKARDAAVEKLLPAEFIGKDGDWVWRTGKRVFNVDRSPSGLLMDTQQGPATVGELSDLPF
jgi:hypothetical protein